MSHTYKYPRPAGTTDCVAVRFDEDQLKLLLIKRNQPPFKGSWALPGGFLDMGEDLEACVRRELEEETGLTSVYVEQLKAYGDTDRDPRGRTVSVAFLGLVRPGDHFVNAGSDASDAEWFLVDELPNLAFDHDVIISDAWEMLRRKVRVEPVGFELLPNKFPLRDLQKLYELILDQELDKRNFRKKILELDVLVDLNQFEKDVSHRAAKLYRFDKRKFQRMRKSGLSFEL